MISSSFPSREISLHGRDVVSRIYPTWPSSPELLIVRLGRSATYASVFVIINCRSPKRPLKVSIFRRTIRRTSFRSVDIELSSPLPRLCTHRRLSCESTNSYLISHLCLSADLTDHRAPLVGSTQLHRMNRPSESPAFAKAVTFERRDTVVDVKCGCSTAGSCIMSVMWYELLKLPKQFEEENWICTADERKEEVQ